MKRKELEIKLKAEGFAPNTYSLYGELNTYSIVIYHNYYIWEVFYLDERGGRNMLGLCSSEDEACDLLYRELMKERSLRNEL